MAMRKLLVSLWLLVPVAALGYHLGPGQERLAADKAAAALARADAAAAKARATAAAEGDGAARASWAEAEAAWTEALNLLPSNETTAARSIRLERAKAQMFLSELPEARRELESLVGEIAGDAASDPALLADARGTLASAQYYTTWLMRLEGLSRDEWQPEIDSARQTYRLLAEQAEKSGDTTATKKSREDLEAAIRLERMEIGDLQGLPLPSQ
jgi:hypothetical protein